MSVLACLCACLLLARLLAARARACVMFTSECGLRSLLSFFFNLFYFIYCLFTHYLPSVPARVIACLCACLLLAHLIVTRARVCVMFMTDCSRVRCFVLFFVF